MRLSPIKTGRLLAAGTLVVLAVACATGSTADIGEGEGTALDGGGGAEHDALGPGVDGAIPDGTGGPGDADGEGGPIVSCTKVSCAGYDYPETVTTGASSCAGALSGCTGTHEFRVVGCFTSTPAVSPCPAGYKVAANMLIGLWAQAANVTREGGGEPLVCMYTASTTSDNTPLTSACGFDIVKNAYCWKRGDGCGCPDFTACGGTCCYQVCHSASTVCSAAPYEAPVLCVK